MPEWIDFGAPAACGAHRFRLEIPQASRAAVALYEDMGFAGDGSRPEERLWLFGRTARFAPLADDCQRGWRRALALMMGEAAPSARLRRREGAAGRGGEEGAQIFLKLES